MKVYVITRGTYSDYSIYAVTLDKKQAELFKARYSDEWDEAHIEEYETEEYKIEVNEDYKPMWAVSFCSNEMCNCYIIAHKNHKHGTACKNEWDGSTTVFVEAKDKEHAKKNCKRHIF